MLILKFGGTSLASPDTIPSVAGIIREAHRRHGAVCVVASAFSNVTNQLIEVCNRALMRDSAWGSALAAIEDRHLDAVRLLVPGAAGGELSLQVREACGEIRELALGIARLRELTPRTLDAVMSYGERLSARILAAALSAGGLGAAAVDSRLLIKTDLSYGAARVNFDLTNWNILNWFKDRAEIQVVTGFVASGKNSETTTLGRGGSDYTAAILGAALDAREVQIWTDVDGVMTADPSKVAHAFSLESITYEEAMELSHFGAKVIHFPTMLPAMNKGIDIRILNTFHPSFPGTLITTRRVVSDKSVKGIASLDSVCLISVKGIGMMRATGIAGRIFSALAAQEIDVILITQSSSEHSVCFAVHPVHRARAREAIELEFRLELMAGEIAGITVEDDQAVLAVVGEETRNVPGIAGKVFQALGKNGINIRAIAQGASELNLTFVVRRADEAKALNALHDNLFLSRYKTVHLFVIGTGLVGSALLDLIRDQCAFARETYHVNMKVVGITNRRKMIVDAQGIDPACWREMQQNAGDPADLGSFMGQLTAQNLANSMMIDCTASREVANHYLVLAEASISIVAASKIANTLSQDFYRQLRAAMRKFNAQFRYSTNVGAALPILESIKSIVNNGDRIVRIEGVLSGTLSAVFNDLHDGARFSEAVRTARARGFTEPDPRTDLSGMDMARKLLILVRESGLELELEQIVVESLVPPELDGGLSPGEFLEALPGLDARIRERVFAAHEHGARPMYIASFAGEGARVGIQDLEPSHPFYGLTGNDNIVALTTDSLYERPLVLRGGGAGAGRTASGLFTDILQVAHGMS